MDEAMEGGGSTRKGNRDERRRLVSRRSLLKGAAVGAAATATDVSFLSGFASAAATTIAVENAKAGTPDWDLGFLDDSIEGFTAEYSLNAGQTVHFKIRTVSSNYRIDIYRMGWYGGAGGRKVATVTPSARLPQSQPAPITDAFTGILDCGNWAVSASWVIPADAVSGVYVANMVRQDGASNGLANRTIFVVRNDGRVSDLLVQTSDTTYQAYNDWGGNSLYFGTAHWDRAVKVSYNRPVIINELENSFWYSELPLIRWLERNGYDVSYTSCIDTDARPAELLKHKVFVSSGHDEYWSGAQRANVEAARAAGVHLVFMTGNEVFWKVRWESSVDGSGTPYRTLVCYKETLESAKTDPSPEWTGTWRDPRFSPPSNGGRPENALTGTLFKAINPVEVSDFAIEVPYAYSRLRMWRNTSIASLATGTKATLTNDTLGYEWNTDGDFPSRPAGLVRFSETTKTANQVLQDYGKTYISAPLTHYITMYKHSSGALVWSTGTVQWSWGLDEYHPNRPNNDVAVDVRIQQATTNVLADMGVQPNTIMAGLVKATKSTDTLPPVSTFTTPAAGASAVVGTALLISGTSTDAGGGRVGGVEVSTDNGTTWHPAVGTSSWSYSYTPMTLGTFTVKVRATDDSLNTEAPKSRSFNGVARPFPCSLFTSSTPAPANTYLDTQPLELGVRFQVSAPGFATGIKFYKAVENTGVHTGRLWTNTGQLLSTVQFANETASGWQSATLATPVTLAVGVTYVVSYSCPSGKYSGDPGFFNTAYDLAPLLAPASTATAGNGLYGTPGAFPTSSFGATNYWVDVVFDNTDHKAPTIIDFAPATGVNAVDVSSSVTVTFSEAMTAASIVMGLTNAAGATIAGTTSLDAATNTARFTPSAPLAPLTLHTATVTAAKDLSGQAMVGTKTWTFTTAGAAGTTPGTIWTSASVPTQPSVQDTAIELGLQFKSDVDGLVTGVRFYKGLLNTGTHIGRLWTAGGVQLASVTFANESATGWQQALFSAPVAIKKNTVYVVSYYAPNGGYAADSNYFATSETVRAPLHALSTPGYGPNGVYHYGAGGGFPTNSFASTNYWVDVLFLVPIDTGAPNPVNWVPANGLQAVDVSLPISVTFDKAINTSNLQFTVSAGGTPVSGAVSWDAATMTARFTPTAALARGTVHSVSVKATGAPNGSATMATPLTFSFTTAKLPGQLPATIWTTAALPATVAAEDSASVELGMKFRADVDGAITALRYYKAASNTGTHVGHIWSAAGVQLGSVVFANETQSGWQQANFAAPIPIAAGVTYVASYLAPVGQYSATTGGLGSAADAAPLHALASATSGGNGVYAYGAGAFPSQSFGSSNYWVDVVFVDNSAPSVTATSPAANATGVALGTGVTATFSEAMQPASIAFQLRDGGGNLVAGSLSYDPATFRATFQPTSALVSATTYTATVASALDSAGNPMAAPASWSFRTVDASRVTLFDARTPVVASNDDTSPLELGMRFKSTVAGNVLGVRFYKGPINTGAHVGHLWTEAGTLLASVNFSGESASGWQEATFSTPVAITPGTNYVVSYFAPAGGFALDYGFFDAGDFVNGPLVGIGNPTAPNGLFNYSAGGGFPTNSVGGSNYWVDVIFTAS